MLRELVDRAALEDIVSGLARASGLRTIAYDSDGRLLTASPPLSVYALLVNRVLDQIPRPLEFTPLPADEPPARVAFTEHAGVWYVVVPVFLHEEPSGYVAVGELRDSLAPATPPVEVATLNPQLRQRLSKAWEALPELRRSGDAHCVVTARWASRLLSDWCRHEAQLDAAAEGLSLLGDIGALLSGEQNLQRVLDRIVAETARVMKCRYCSMRLYDAKTGELQIAAVYNLSESYLHKGSVLRSENPIDDEALSGHVVYIEDATRDPRIRYRDASTREGIVSGLTVGMIYHGSPIGVLRVYTDRKQRFRTAQRHLIRAVASQAAIAIVNARMAEQRLRSEEMERQIQLAGKLQARMVRTAPPAFPSVDAALVFEPTWHIGGDFCDFLLLPDGRFAALVADVVGHGVQSSLLMAYVRGAIRAVANQTADLGELLTRLNRQLCEETDASEFVTLFLATIDPAGQSLRYACAGHDAPLILRGEGVVRADCGEMVLGINPQETYHVHELPLVDKDFLLLFTDGVCEAMNFAGELYGRDRLEAALRTAQGLSPHATLQSVLWDVRRFIGLAEQSDDITLVGLRTHQIGG